MSKSVLFIGNSFTYYNDLPGQFADAAKKAGLDMEVESLVKGGWYLNRYADPEDEMGSILREKYVGREWDYLILQEQSFQAVKDYEDFLQSIKALCSLLKAKQVLLYQTWAYEEGSEKLAGTGLSYVEMYLRMRESYVKAAEEIGAYAVPVGDLFFNTIKTEPHKKLYCEDNFHPSPEGTNLALCAFMDTISRLERELSR